ncbi:molybdenum cofactor guanylyltransferase [Catenuloplanes indicus]|uniref:Molybdopterin-guanine dinucleotide biosynthesis protein A n=1 Tax=Catenuloplanes indicus TaxID=137267 RepID=A0AAE3W3I7_9ACTN|nr:NTP transferase domain-containing protein [Catenuloplanes indicus]MDQ0367690.1 molybdopterin-guanine dinucleotide biosynthesis protein A [Catenuloplanes indicus]
MDARDCGVVVLAGGRGSRLGGVVKPGLPVGGRTMLSRVLDATAALSPRVVVGPDTLTLPAGVLRTVESPPGGGPVAGAAAGLSVLVRADPGTRLVALLAGDLPMLTPAALGTLAAPLTPPTAHRTVESRPPAGAAGYVDGVCFVDAGGRRQLLCGVWRVPALVAALDGLAGERGGLDGASMRALFARLRVREETWGGSGVPPWFDCDTEEDLRRAETWAAENP